MQHKTMNNFQSKADLLFFFFSEEVLRFESKIHKQEVIHKQMISDCVHLDIYWFNMILKCETLTIQIRQMETQINSSQSNTILQ